MVQNIAAKPYPYSLVNAQEDNINIIGIYRSLNWIFLEVQNLQGFLQNALLNNYFCGRQAATSWDSSSSVS